MAINGSSILLFLYVPSDAAFQKLKDARKNKTPIKVKIDNQTADAVVESISSEFPDDDTSTVSVSIKLTSELA
jgi:hypothetical protein